MLLLHSNDYGMFVSTKPCPFTSTCASFPCPLISDLAADNSVAELEEELARLTLTEPLPVGELNCTMIYSSGSLSTKKNWPYHFI